MANGGLSGQLNGENTETNNIYCCVHRFKVMVMLYSVSLCQLLKKSATSRQKKVHCIQNANNYTIYTDYNVLKLEDYI